ncbi:hypothetical protein FB451DRAFT_1376408 [Mycena latifolia]|nr:hypothetical protein FB451DRAFT_1376408 [Mycena latifolia]
MFQDFTNLLNINGDYGAQERPHSMNILRIFLVVELISLDNLRYVSLTAEEFIRHAKQWKLCVALTDIIDAEMFEVLDDLFITVAFHQLCRKWGAESGSSRVKPESLPKHSGASTYRLARDIPDTLARGSMNNSKIIIEAIVSSDRVSARLLTRRWEGTINSLAGDLGPPNQARFEGCLPIFDELDQRVGSHDRLAERTWNISTTTEATDTILVSTGSYDTDDEYRCPGRAIGEELRSARVSDSDIQMTSNTELYDSGLTQD